MHWATAPVFSIFLFIVLLVVYLFTGCFFSLDFVLVSAKRQDQQVWLFTDVKIKTKIMFINLCCKRLICSIARLYYNHVTL